VLNYADYDLHRVIQRHVPFSEEHIRLIIYSLLRGLKVEIYPKGLYSFLLFLFSLFIQLVLFIV
jgi:hypothetical protein